MLSYTNGIGRTAPIFTLALITLVTQAVKTTGASPLQHGVVQTYGVAYGMAPPTFVTT